MINNKAEDEELLVRQGLEELKTEYDRALRSVGDGWGDLIKIIFYTARSMWIRYGIKLDVRQVKEKMGTLRFYYTLELEESKHPSVYENGVHIGYRIGDEVRGFEFGRFSSRVPLETSKDVLRNQRCEFFGFISAVEWMSGNVCEQCSNRGFVDPIPGGWWLKCLCQNCRNKKQKETNETTERQSDVNQV